MNVDTLWLSWRRWNIRHITHIGGEETAPIGARTACCGATSWNIEPEVRGSWHHFYYRSVGIAVLVLGLHPPNETSLQWNTVSHWLSRNQESALYLFFIDCDLPHVSAQVHDMYLHNTQYIVNLWHGNVFHITGLLRGESTGHRWIPLTKGQWYGALWFPSLMASTSRWMWSCWKFKTRRC